MITFRTQASDPQQYVLITNNAVSLLKCSEEKDTKKGKQFFGFQSTVTNQFRILEYPG